MRQTRFILGVLGWMAILFGITELVHADEKATTPRVTLLRVPDHGIQPQVAVDRQGRVHMIYFRGDAGHGDVFYARLENGDFSSPMQVNSRPGSSIAVGNIRGPQMALGKNSRVHVCWNGSGKADKGPSGQSPMLYTRLNDAGTAFEPERNVIQAAYGLDGGGSVAADDAGNVYVAWHAPKPGVQGEENRCVWVAYSSDEGKTFAPEHQANSEPTGACGCCGMKAFADSTGVLHFLYRSAAEKIHRDMCLLTSKDRGVHFQGEKLQEWEGGICPMSMESFCQAGDAVWAAWEIGEQVYFSPVERRSSMPLAPPGEAKRRKFPVLAVNRDGFMILAWTEGMGWQKGGAVAWQVFDKKGQPVGKTGRADGVPVWSLVAVFARPDGGFTIVY
jgi:hypothetical protein